MIEKSIENFIINACYLDVLDYSQQGKVPMVTEYEVNQWSYLVEIMIVTIKSLRPSQKDNGNVIDYERFENELELWKSYRHGMNRNLLYSIDNKDNENYFTCIDESIYPRIAVITIANQDWETIKSEVIKNILFSSGNIEVTLECLTLAKLLFLILRDKNYEYDNILSELKNEIINFSQQELISYDSFYRRPKEAYEKNYKIEFERMRINLISLLNEIDISNNFTVLKESLEILKDEENQEEFETEQNTNFFISGLLGVISEEVESRDIKDVKFLESLCTYISRLRKGRIDIDDLKFKRKDLPNIFSFDQGHVFSHPLLNKAQIIYKGKRDTFEMAYVKTQTGIYRFVNLEKN